MSEIKMIRQPTVAGVKMIYEFTEGVRFLISNFTDGDIYVSDEKDATKEDSILIPAQCARIFLTNEYNTHIISNIQIIPDATSPRGVEVQCIRW